MKRKFKQIIAGLLTGVILAVTVPAQAAEVNNDAVYGISTNEIAEWPQGPGVTAETAVLMDADTGMILYNKGMDELRYPASITKVMTALLALEHSGLEDPVTFTAECQADQTSDSGNIGMQVGEVLTMQQCLMALMIQSANDVATQIAVQISGSVAAFADLMNQKAQELGCVNTHFVNASGMPDENHYTTAHDMALIFREALKNDTFREIISTQSYTIEPTNLNPESRTYSIHNPLAAQSAPEYYEACLGGKTGFTSISKNTLVTGAQKNGMTLICVTLRADLGQLCQDQIHLYDYGFDHFQKLEVPGGSVVIPNGTEVSALTKTEQEDSTEDYYYQETYYVGSGSAAAEEPEEEPVVLQAEDPEEPEASDAEKEKEPEAEKEPEQDLKEVYRGLVYILVGCVALAVLIAVLSGTKKKKRKKG